MRPSLAACLLLGLLTAPVSHAAPKLADMLPEGPVLDAAALAAFDAPAPSGVIYTGPPRVHFPVLPLQVFGLHYDVDIVLVSRHPDWDMHEYARVSTPSGPVWLAKDADTERVQTIVSDLPDLDALAPEVPIVRLVRPVRVRDRSVGDRVDVDLAYTNSKGQPVTVSYRGRMARRPPSARNGATMGHSANMAAVVLDLSRFKHGGRARIEIDGHRWRLDHLLGFYPQKYLLAQTQGGVVITRFREEATEDGFELTRPDPTDAPWPTHSNERWIVTEAGDEQRATVDSGLTGLSYRFRDGEWLGAEVRQVGQEQPVFAMRLSPALPDLRRPFEGVATSRFSFDVHGQQGHGAGVVTARWDGDQVLVTLIPEAPRDLARRPMEGAVRFTDGAVHVETHRSPGTGSSP